MRLAPYPQVRWLDPLAPTITIFEKEVGQEPWGLFLINIMIATVFIDWCVSRFTSGLALTMVATQLKRCVVVKQDSSWSQERLSGLVRVGPPEFTAPKGPGRCYVFGLLPFPVFGGLAVFWSLDEGNTSNSL